MSDIPWNGRFSSLRLPPGIISGNIVVDNLDPHGEGYTSKARVVYTGIFRKGRKLEITLTAKGDTMEVDLDGRLVQFTIQTRADKMLTGKYVIKRSNDGQLDHGQFYLQPEGCPPIENHQNCCIQ